MPQDGAYSGAVHNRLKHLSETFVFEGLQPVDASALRLELMREDSFSTPTSWSLFELGVGAWLVRRVWVDTRNSSRREPFRYGSDAKVEPGLAEGILGQLETLVLPAFVAPAVGLDGTWRSVRRPGTGTQRIDVGLNWWEEPPGFISANQWFDWTAKELDELLPHYSPTP